MSWITFVFLSLVALAALSACALCAQQIRRQSVEIASLWSAFSSLEKSERLTPSRLAELAQLNAALDQGNVLLHKINTRLTSAEWRAAREKKNNTIGAPEVGSDDLKRQLRVKAGLLRGS